MGKFSNASFKLDELVVILNLLIGSIKFANLFSLYLSVFMKDQNEAEPEEYKIVYSLDGSSDLFEKYFMANDPEAASGMFTFVCKKNDLIASVDKVEKWNRWSKKWEVQEKQDSSV